MGYTPLLAPAQHMTYIQNFPLKQNFHSPEKQAGLSRQSFDARDDNIKDSGLERESSRPGGRASSVGGRSSDSGTI